MSNVHLINQTDQTLYQFFDQLRRLIRNLQNLIRIIILLFIHIFFRKSIIIKKDKNRIE